MNALYNTFDSLASQIVVHIKKEDAISMYRMLCLKRRICFMNKTVFIKSFCFALSKISMKKQKHTLVQKVYICLRDIHNAVSTYNSLRIFCEKILEFHGVSIVKLVVSHKGIFEKTLKPISLFLSKKYSLKSCIYNEHVCSSMNFGYQIFYKSIRFESSIKRLLGELHSRKKDLI